MTEPARSALTSAAHHEARGDDEMTMALLRIAFPEFWFGRLSHRRQPARWVAVCKDNASLGLYMAAAADPDALTAALLCDQVLTTSALCEETEIRLFLPYRQACWRQRQRQRPPCNGS